MPSGQNLKINSPDTLDRIGNTRRQGTLTKKRENILWIIIAVSIMAMLLNPDKDEHVLTLRNHELQSKREAFHSTEEGRAYGFLVQSNNTIRGKIGRIDALIFSSTRRKNDGKLLSIGFVGYVKTLDWAHDGGQPNTNPNHVGEP